MVGPQHTASLQGITQQRQGWKGAGAQPLKLIGVPAYQKHREGSLIGYLQMEFRF